jgi:hypothetical protein
MPLNTVAPNNRTMPLQNKVTANGSYTLPQLGFIPANGTRPITGGNVPANNGHAGNPGFIIASHVDASQLPGANYARAVGIRTQTAQIQINPQAVTNQS